MPFDGFGHLGADRRYQSKDLVPLEQKPPSSLQVRKFRGGGLVVFGGRLGQRHFGRPSFGGAGRREKSKPGPSSDLHRLRPTFLPNGALIL